MGKKKKDKHVVSLLTPLETVEEDVKPPPSKKQKVDDDECVEDSGTSKIGSLKKIYIYIYIYIYNYI